MELTPFFIGLYKFVKHGLYPLTWVVLLLSAATRASSPSHQDACVGYACSLRPPPPMTLYSPLVATPLIGSLESWHHPPQLTKSDRFDVIMGWVEASTRKARLDQPPSHLLIPEIEPPAVWTSTGRATPQYWC